MSGQALLRDEIAARLCRRAGCHSPQMVEFESVFDPGARKVSRERRANDHRAQPRFLWDSISIEELKYG
jgi:hypothetical protein